MSDARVRELAEEYWRLRDSLKQTRRITRHHKVVYARWIEIYREVLVLRPGENPLLVIRQVSGRVDPT